MIKLKNQISTKLFFFLIVWVLCFSARSALGQVGTLDLGLRLQKTLNLYYENGVTLQYSSPGLLKNRFSLGFNFVSSRLGSAINSNALKQDNIFFSGTYLFRPKRTIHPFLRANAGWFQAEYESEMFQNLDSSSPLLSAEAGLMVPTTARLKTGASLGYNLITGNGTEGPGTLYPVFYQLSLTWSLFKNATE